MITDSPLRQFLLKNRKLISWFYIEKQLNMPFKTINRWVNGKKPLPDHWHEQIEFVLGDLYSRSRKEKLDMVLVLDESYLLPEFKGTLGRKVTLDMFKPSVIKDREVIYYKYTNERNRTDCLRSLFSVYREIE